MTITIRALSPDDWPGLRAFWLDGLTRFPQFFGGYEWVQSAPATLWKNAIQGPRQQMFGLFAEDVLIGVTAVFARREDPSGQTAIFGMSFIAPAFRGRGLSRLLYDARLDWARAQNFTRVMLSHRQSNQESRRAHRRYGFVLTERGLQTGPDGETENEEYYELGLGD